MLLQIKRSGFTPRRRWLLKGIKAAVEAFWAAGIEEISIDGSFCTEKPDPGDVDSYWVEPDEGVYDRIDPVLDRFRAGFGATHPKMEVAHVGGLWGRVLHPSSHAGRPPNGFPRILSTGRRRATSRNCSSSEGGRAMIKSDAQRERTLAQIEGFRQALAKVASEKPGKRSAAIRGSYKGMIRQLEDELKEYDQLKSGELEIPRIERLDQIAPFIVKLRISKGVSQTELAGRLGVSKQVISRYEESDYQTVAVSRLQEILDAIGIKTVVTITA